MISTSSRARPSTLAPRRCSSCALRASARTTSAPTLVGGGGARAAVCDDQDRDRRARAVRRSVARSLRALQLEYVNLVLIHSPHSSLTAARGGADATWLPSSSRSTRCAARARSRASASATGLFYNYAILIFDFCFSSHKTRHLPLLWRACPSLPQPSCNQVECTPFVPQREVAACCAEQGTALVSYSPLAHAVESVAKHAIATLGALSRKHGVSWAR